MAAPTPRQAEAFLAAMALRIGRYENVIKAIDTLVKNYGQELTGEDRHLIFTTFTSVTLEKISLLRILRKIEKEDGYNVHGDEIKSFRDITEIEMVHVCNKAIEVIEQYLVPSSTMANERVLLLKTAGDLNWYLLSVVKECNKKSLNEKTMRAYGEALSVSKCLSPADPLKLSVQLNLSAFYMDELCDMRRALLLANQAISQAGPFLQFLDEKPRMTSKLILKLVYDNMMIWAAATQAIKDEELQVEVEEHPEHQKRLLEAMEKQETGTVDEVHAPDLVAEADSGQQLQLMDVDQEALDKCQLEANADEESKEKNHKSDGAPVAELLTEPVAVAEGEGEGEEGEGEGEGEEVEAQPDPQHWGTPYSRRSPSPVQRVEVPPLPRLTFEDPPDDEPYVRSRSKIRQRMKASQARRGSMG